ncbi:lipocalin family protein [Epilithonimonas arachidiradicis]|uniref:Outer membrane lipoprotein Blc n=1 Tax=Epilithonimonas arachidiradicis TaxID=1617282 RepID=A0A420D9M1_9FLAO|nr:lipocalin family protein [Epilithonimonas arachidiradicis]RKE87669.1 apolipoprotein D and lipocalin family protein [Epilithonimonas arachidiradicis]GGG57003.1 membrane protein [Epilithonimonas arachidiradicis]
MKKTFTKTLVPVSIGIIGLLVLSSCSVGIPDKATAVQNFDADKYLGKWYEIARFDYRFEKNMNQVTATYSKNADGTIKVENKGYDYVKKEWKQSTGEAKFVNSENEARLKVSFFKPFWAGYNVIDLDSNYKYALVAGKNLDYLWILSREKTIPEDVKNRFLEKAKEIGYNTSELIWVEQK